MEKEITPIKYNILRLLHVHEPNAEQNILIFKVLASFLAGILKLMHHMVNLSNESGQAWLGLIVLRYYYHVFIWTP